MGRSQAMEAFHYYLRTGRRRRVGALEHKVEAKSNPYHDPRNGRFITGPSGASRGDGTWTGGGFTGGGGGSFGGGGATGSWGMPDGQLRSNHPVKTNAPRTPLAESTTRPSGAIKITPTSAANERTIVRNGYTYRLDTADRTTSVTGTLILNPAQRSRSAQAGAGGTDRRPTDDGGHYIAVRFDGPTDKFNHFAQNANFNRGDYRVMEDGWAKDIKQGKRVYVSITPRYLGSSQRPWSIDVAYIVNGARRTRIFPNDVKGKSYGG